jgi:uncharacterized protein HemX
MSILAYALKNPLMALCAVLALIAVAASGVAYVQNARVDSMQSKLTLADERAKTAEKALSEALEARKRVDEALAQREAEIASYAARSASAKAVIDKSRNTEADRPISPMVGDFLDALRQGGPK